MGGWINQDVLNMYIYILRPNESARCDVCMYTYVHTHTHKHTHTHTHTQDGVKTAIQAIAEATGEEPTWLY